MYSQGQSHVLVVDDSKSNRVLLRSILAAAGYEVDECENGKECIDFCKSERPEIVLLDLMMPEVDGLTACRYLRDLYTKEELPVIVVSARTENEDVLEGLRVGANDYVTKPIDREILLARIENQLSLSAAQKLLKEQKLSAERALKIQNALGDILPDAILIHDLDGKIVYSNEHLLDACHGELFENVDNVFGNLFNGFIASQCEDIYTSSKDDYNFAVDKEVEVFDTIQHNFRIVSRPIVLEDDTRLRVWLLQDISHVRELERKINQQVKLDTVSQFASGVAHNFNNMMGSILGASDLLQRMIAEEEKAMRCVEVVRKAVKSGSKLTRKMSILVKEDINIGSSGHDDVIKIIRSVVEVQQEMLKLSEKKIEFILDLPESAYVLASTRNLIDIFNNLLSNAIDAIDRKGAVIFKVDVVSEHNQLHVSLKDSGCGMGPEQLERIYEPFFSTKNLDERNNVSMEGNGLGMWNVYNLLKMLSGDIQISSQLGVGTEVLIKLPLA